MTASRLSQARYLSANPLHLPAGARRTLAELRRRAPRLAPRRPEESPARRAIVPLRMARRTPAWACTRYDQHGEDHVCADCLVIYERQGSVTTGFDMPPRVRFGEGWFHVGATHWFPATPDKVFPSRDGSRLLAAAVCGLICEMTITWAPKVGRECRKCQRALAKMSARPGGQAVH